MAEKKNLDGVRGWGRASRHAPPGDSATAEARQGSRARAHLPGPPGDVHTARTATDTWSQDDRHPTIPPNEPIMAEAAERPHDTAGAAGGEESSG